MNRYEQPVYKIYTGGVREKLSDCNGTYKRENKILRKLWTTMHE